MAKTLFSTVIYMMLLIHSTVYADAWTQQRWEFKQAYQALLEKDDRLFNQYSAKLDIASYPIAHYLHYLYLKEHLEKTDAIQTFLKHNQNSPLEKTLRQAWLIYLAQQKDWQTFLSVYTPQTETILQCYYLQAQLETKKSSSTAIEAAKTLWLVGKSQPDECDGLFTHLYKNALITDDLRWQRAHLALQNGELGLASFLAKSFPQDKQQLIAQWRDLHENPATALEKFSPPDEIALATEMLQYGLKRLAREDAAQAFVQLEHYQKQYQLTEGEAGATTFRYLALRAASQQLPKAEQWLKAVDKTVIDEDVQQARLQFALTQGNWQTVLAMTEQMTTDDLKWRYWRARALEETQQVEKAREIFMPLAQERHYYGFAAAERLQQPYHFGINTIKASKKALSQLLTKPEIIRARELYLVGLTGFARAEWQVVLNLLSEEELKVAAVLAHQWGWYDRAIVTVTKAKAFDDLVLRFPTPFYDTVLAQATAKKLDVAWVYAVMRQESAFQVDARSVSNALGLMQLLPSTAKEVADKLGVTFNSEADILKPELNIRLGTSYLRYLLDRFDNNRLLATAGYNAGPSRAKQWASERACLPTDVWIELIPFNQTRDYVQRVMSYAPIFTFQWVNNASVATMPLDKVTENCAQ